MKLLGISGSLRQASSNTNLLEAAGSLLPSHVEFELEPEIAALPLFNPDVEVSSNTVVEGFVDRVRACDGVIFSSPVYAGGYPGALKNALDWLVGTDAYVAKPFMMLSASSRVPEVERSLIKVVETMSGVHITAASTTIALLGKNYDAQMIVADQQMADAVRRALACFVSAIEDNG